MAAAHILASVACCHIAGGVSRASCVSEERSSVVNVTEFCNVIRSSASVCYVLQGTHPQAQHTPRQAPRTAPPAQHTHLPRQHIHPPARHTPPLLQHTPPPAQPTHPPAQPTHLLARPTRPPRQHTHPLARPIHPPRQHTHQPARLTARHRQHTHPQAQVSPPSGPSLQGCTAHCVWACAGLRHSGCTDRGMQCVWTSEG